MKNSQVETYAMLQGITSIIESFTSNYNRDNLFDENIIAYIGFSSKEELVKECIDKYIQVYESGRASSFEENSNWFMNFMTACLTLDISFDDGTNLFLIRFTCPAISSTLRNEERIHWYTAKKTKQ
mgnify:CR=1 FL=1